MAEWLYEDGIGEQRAALVDAGRILAAEIELEGGLKSGLVATARLIEAARGGGLVLVDGMEAALARVPVGLSVGRELTVEVVREAIPEVGRPKRAKVIASDRPATSAPTLAERIATDSVPGRHIRAHEPDVFEEHGWSELLEEATTGEIAFAGGALRVTQTPAMTLFDVDGVGDAETLATLGARAAAEAIMRHRIGGSIGIDLPTVQGKDARQRIAAEIDAVLPQPFERTAVNGFGFLQIVRPRPRASLPELLRADPVGAAARAALRRIERVPAGAPNAHRLPPAVLDRIEANPAWIAELVRRTGRTPIWNR